MSLIFDTKEDLHLRMVDLQQKLKESEEERRKLEKTCSALIRAFREDERMHYKALNNQYENFLEDCRLRKKRNDIILKSLYKVEDRAKSLFNKTEKLKLLKDRHTAYLKQNDFLKGEKIQNEMIPKLETSLKEETKSKSVHWKTPILQDLIDSDINDMHHLYKNSKKDTLLETSIEDINKKISQITDEQNNSLHKFLVTNQNDDVLESTKKYKGIIALQEDSKIKPLYKNPNIKNKDNENISNEIKSGCSKSYINAETAELIHAAIIRDKDQSFEKTSAQEIILYFKEKINESPTVNNITSCNEKKGNSLLKNVPYFFEKTFKDNLELKMSNFKPLSRENNQWNEMEKKYFEVERLFTKNIKDQNLFDDLKKDGSPETLSEKTIFESDELCHNSSSLIFLGKADTSFANETKEEKNSKDCQADLNSEASCNSKIYPKGLDGVDYENETYPDSYYEQPEPTRNMSSIASDVILEEDEYDLEVDQEKTLSFIASQHTQTSNLLETNILPSEGNNFEKNYNPSCFSVNLTNQISKCIINKEPLHSIEENCSDIEKNNECGRNSIESFQLLDQFESEGTNSEQSVKQEKEAFTLPTDEYKCSTEANVFQDKGSIAEGNNSIGRSNLIQLLESDSESFQIEHGEPISGNEDSDFDFSFNL